MECIIRLEENKNENCNSTRFSLTVSDDGIGIPKNLEIEDIENLGLQLVTFLIHQLDGELELKMNNGTEFNMRFTLIDKLKHELISTYAVN